ncbi:MAG: TatD family hydrolase [Candidatus Margulisiibacteriota bacterium]
MYIDTHAHLTFPELAPDLPAVIQRAKEANLEALITIALDEESLQQSLKLSAEYPGYIYTAAGIHPQEASRVTAAALDDLKQIARKQNIVAIGETGLDYHYLLSPIEQQKEAFRAFLKMAQELDRPAVIHSRDAARDTLTIMREENRGKLKGVLHCFAGDMALGQGALDMGLYISFTGNITFPKAEIIRAAAKAVPLERIMIETDCPFLAPQSFRGTRNEPAYVIEVAKKLAEIKGLTIEEVALATTRNARRLFGI